MKSTKRWGLALALILSSMVAWADTLTVDAGTDLGPLKYGATGFLYGLGDEGIPSNAVLGALRPQVAAQKAPDGLQHPNGDALKTAPLFLRNGGQQIQIYLQDVYKEWPYEKLGIGDYLKKIETMVKKVMKDPNRDAFAYIPLNEPDVIWYGSEEKEFYKDWKLCFQKIKALDPQAKVCGPNYTGYDSGTMRRFLTFAVKNNCVPDIMTWHELQNDFFTQWDRHLSTYRDIEKELGISPRPIVINEYGRFSGDLGVPGHLLQYVARFERDGIDGCLAYWTTAGSLNDLVTANNRPTGGWWLYQWYGEMTGRLLAVTPPNRNLEALQGLASFDPARGQLKVIAGGDDGESEVVIRGLEKAFPGESLFHLVLWRTDSTGLKPAGNPVLVSSGDLAADAGVLKISLGTTAAESAYLAVVTPAKTASPLALPAGRLGAEDQPFTGGTFSAATLPGYTGTGYAVLTGPGDGLRFPVNVPRDGYYNLGLTYRSEEGQAPSLALTGLDLGPWNLASTAGTWAASTKNLFLPAGISLVQVTAVGTGLLAVDGLDLAPSTGPWTEYQAEAPANVLSGTAKVQADKKADGGAFVGGLGGGERNTLTFTGVTVPSAGTYWVVVTYANGELGPGASNYNANIVDRSADLRVGTGPAKTVFFRNTLGWKNYRTLLVSLDLAAGANTVTIGNPSKGFAPNVDKMAVAALVAPPAAAIEPPAEEPGEPEDPLEAESSMNKRRGAAVVSAQAEASGAAGVGYIGNGEENTLTFTEVTAAQAGSYKLTFSYISGEPRNLEVSVNGAKAVRVKFPSSGSWTTVKTVSVTVRLEAGKNTIQVGNPVAFGPDLDRISLAPLE